MQIAVTFRHMEADESVKDYVKEKVEKLEKYVKNPKEVHVVLAAEKFRHLAEITLKATGGTFNSQGRDNDIYAAIDQMADKIERQIRQWREKVRTKRANASSRASRSLGGKTEAEEEKREGGARSLIRRKRTTARAMTIEAAFSQLNTSKKNFFIFVNSESGQINVIGRSKSGDIEWVEPLPK